MSGEAQNNFAYSALRMFKDIGLGTALFNIVLHVEFFHTLFYQVGNVYIPLTRNYFSKCKQTLLCWRFTSPQAIFSIKKVGNGSLGAPK